MDRHEPLRLHDRQEGLELLLLGVAGGVDVLQPRVDDLGAEADETVDDLVTLISLPGIGCEERITVSPSPMLSHGSAP